MESSSFSSEDGSWSPAASWSPAVMIINWFLFSSDGKPQCLCSRPPCMVIGWQSPAYIYTYLLKPLCFVQVPYSSCTVECVHHMAYGMLRNCLHPPTHPRDVHSRSIGVLPFLMRRDDAAVSPLFTPLPVSPFLFARHFWRLYQPLSSNRCFTFPFLLATSLLAVVVF